MRRRLAHVLLLVLCLALPSVPAVSAKLISVPEGNRNASQPQVPGASIKRTRQTKTTFDRKYEKIRDLLKRDTRLRGKISDVAATYEIDPLHIAGALVGEHTYNVDAYDRLQSYYIKALAYATGGISFRHDGEDIDSFIQRSEFENCNDAANSLDRWTCRELIWDSRFRGKNVDGKRYPDDRLSAVFFQPFYAGQTFGLGQLSPLTALKYTDHVNRVSGFKRLSHRDGEEVYRAIMNPDITLAYVAAAVRHSIDAYGQIAGFDISTNPGITATLYNVGNPDQRARTLARKNLGRRAIGLEPVLPQENYYGWLVNEKIEELQGLF